MYVYPCVSAFICQNYDRLFMTKSGNALNWAWMIMINHT